MKPLAAVATSFVAMKVIFSHSRKKKGLKTLDEVSRSDSSLLSHYSFVEGALKKGPSRGLHSFTWDAWWVSVTCQPYFG